MFLQEPEIPSLDYDKIPSNTDSIKSAASIYKKNSLRPLTTYQISINKAAEDICVNNPSMLRNRFLLLEEARSKVNETYDFKKGKSRSKRYVPAEISKISTTPKRKKMDQAARMDIIKIF